MLVDWRVVLDNRDVVFNHLDRFLGLWAGKIIETGEQVVVKNYQRVLRASIRSSFFGYRIAEEFGCVIENVDASCRRGTRRLVQQGTSSVLAHSHSRIKRRSATWLYKFASAMPSGKEKKVVGWWRRYIWHAKHQGQALPRLSSSLWALWAYESTVEEKGSTAMWANVGETTSDVWLYLDEILEEGRDPLLILSTNLGTR
jgi:hypothetical protein